MKKTTKKDDFKKLVHSLWDSVDDEVERLELKAFIDDDNMPRMKELNEDDNIGVEEVIILGGYLVLNKLHNELHKDDRDMIEKNLAKVFEGEVGFREVMPDDMPEEVIEALSKMVDSIKSKKKGKK